MPTVRRGRPGRRRGRPAGRRRQGVGRATTAAPCSSTRSTPLVDAAEVVVVGDPVPTTRPVTFTREDPRYGGPVAALLTGRDALLDPPRHARRARVDMPLGDRRGRSAGCARRRTATTAPFLTDAGRPPPARGRARRGAARRRPARTTRSSTAWRCTGCSAGLDLAEVPPEGDEGRDVDTWADLRDLTDRPSGRGTCDDAGRARKSGPVNLHDWIDELSDVLDLEDAEVDEGLVLDLARVAAAQRRAAGRTDHDVPARVRRRRAGRRPRAGRGAGRPGAGAGRGLGPARRRARPRRRRRPDPRRQHASTTPASVLRRA